MRLLDLICKELGVDVGKRWIGSDGYDYKITEEGLIGFYYPTSDDRENFDIDVQLWVNIMLGELKPVWKPVKDEGYYYPMMDMQGYAYTTWEGSKPDMYRFTNNLVFKTKKEAVEVADKMLNALKEELKNEGKRIK